MKRYYKRSYPNGVIYLCHSGVKNEKDFLKAFERENMSSEIVNVPCPNRCVKRIFGYK
jgi:hypothetical protein